MELRSITATTRTSASTSEIAIISARRAAAIQNSSLTLSAQRLTIRLTKLLPTAKTGLRHGRIAKSTFSSTMHPDSNEEMTLVAMTMRKGIASTDREDQEEDEPQEDSRMSGAGDIIERKRTEISPLLCELRLLATWNREVMCKREAVRSHAKKKRWSLMT